MNNLLEVVGSSYFRIVLFIDPINTKLSLSNIWSHTPNHLVTP